MSARIPPVTEPDDAQRALLEKTLLGPQGQPLNIFATLAQRPELMRRVNALGGYFFVKSTLNPRDRELVILRVAALTACAYELGQHRRIAEEAGLSADELEAAIAPQRPWPWPTRDRAMLDLVQTLMATDTVTDAVWAALGENFSDTQRLELIVLVGFYRLLAGVLNGLGVELDDWLGSEPPVR